MNFKLKDLGPQLITVIAVVLIFGFFTSADNHQSISIIPKPGDGSILLSSSFAVSLVWVSYAYTGWNSVIYIAGEIKEPKRNISKAMFFSTGFVMCMYILLNYIFLYTVPIADMVGQVDVGYISGVVIFGNTGAMVIGIGISILLLSTVSSYVYIGPRIMQIMGEDHKLLSFLKIKDNKKIHITKDGDFNLSLDGSIKFVSILLQYGINLPILQYDIIQM